MPVSISLLIAVNAFMVGWECANLDDIYPFWRKAIWICSIALFGAPLLAIEGIVTFFQWLNK